MSQVNDAEQTVRPPRQLHELFGFRQACACGRVHQVDLRGAVVGLGAIEQVVDWVASLGRGLSLALVVDARTWQVAGQRVHALLKADGHGLQVCTLADGAGGRPHADEKTLAVVRQALTGCDLALAVGSGTINDLTKLASFQLERPYLAVATAPSMNGYTSAIAAIMRDGIKRTVSCHQPLAVIADMDVLVKAPRHLIASGLADLESKPTSTADFRLAGLLRGDYYCPAPEDVVLSAEARVAQAAAEIGQGDPAAIALLTEALLLSGISMRLAGTSSPASGGEHLISHHWDMLAPYEGRVEGWHGHQVGVATIVTSSLYESLRELDPAAIDPDAILAERKPKEQLRRELRLRHGPLADLIEPEFFAKHLDDEALRAELEQIRDGWDALWQKLDPVLRPAARVREILRAAGAPTRMNELGLSDEHLRRSFLEAREIRGRFTVLDLAADLGVLKGLAPEVLARAKCMSEGC